VQGIAGVFPLPVRSDPIALRMAGWDGLAAQVEAARRQAGADFVVAEEYGVAAELARALPAGVVMIGLDPRWGLFDLPRASVGGKIGLLVRGAQRGVDGRVWSSATEIGHAERSSGAVTVEAFLLYRVVGGAGIGSAVELPRPVR
jgi:hypothetical protein